MTYPAVDVTAQAELSGVTVYKDVEAKIVSTSASVSIGNGAEETSASFLVPFNDAGAGSVNTTPTYGTGPGTFTRATTATTVNSTGLVALVGTGVARSMYDPSSFITNLCLQSQTLDNGSWVGNSTTVAANVILAPDGTLTADKIQIDNTSNVHGLSQNIIAINTAYTVSAWFKAAEENSVVFANDNTGTCQYDLLTLAVVASPGTGTITPYPNGWYRCTWTFTSAATAALQLSIRLRLNAPFVGVTGNGLYAWGVQLEYSATAGQYVSTTTALRSDFGRYLGYLAEGARTNLCLQSETFNTTWVVSNLTIGANAVASPDGTVTADRIIEDSASTQKSLNQGATTVTATPLTFSVFAKNNGRRYLVVRFNDNAANGNAVSAIFDLQTGVISGAATAYGTFTAPSATITTFPNGWYRCVVTGTSSVVTVNPKLQPSTGSVDVNGEAAIYLGDGASGHYVWGAQLEQAPFASSYMPTTTVAVTRNADILTYPIAANVAAPAYTSYAETCILCPDAQINASSGAGMCLVTTSAGSYGVGNGSLLRASSSNAVDAGGNATSATATYTIKSGLINKFATGLNTTATRTVVVCGNGGTTGSTGTLDWTGVGMTVINIGGLDPSGGQRLWGTIKNVRIWQMQLPDAILQKLTS